jgi:hypothetical protein
MVSPSRASTTDVMSLVVGETSPYAVLFWRFERHAADTSIHVDTREFSRIKGSLIESRTLEQAVYTLVAQWMRATIATCLSRYNGLSKQSEVMCDQDLRIAKGCRSGSVPGYDK